jgi:hypothetical protein
MGAKCDSLSTVADDDVRLNYENDLIHFYEPFIDYRSNHLRKNRNIDCVYILEKAAIRILKPERGIMGLESAVRRGPVVSRMYTQSIFLCRPIFLREK